MTKIIKPNLTLNMDEKIYLAVSKNTANKTAFVYTLACLRQGNTTNYDAIATREVHAFQNNKSDAETFYATVKNVVEINRADKTKQFVFDLNQELIKRFYAQTK